MSTTRRSATPRAQIPAYFLGRPIWVYLDRYAKPDRRRRQHAA